MKRKERGPRGQPKLLLAEDRQDRAFEPDHRPDERIDDNEQRELPPVRAQPQPDSGV